MIDNSKILTVSYGTFSCTLEGFDDSFGTMKAIAEYFRDLAADDRYFGAEPPTPDAEMLARIAEREIERRVNAHSDGGKIVLRAEEQAPVALPAETVAQAAPADAPEEAPTQAPSMEAAAPAAPAPEARADSPKFTAPMPAQSAPALQEEAPAEVEEPADVAQEADEEAVSDADFAANIAALTADEETDTFETRPEETTAEPEEAEEDAPLTDLADADTTETADTVSHDVESHDTETEGVAAEDTGTEDTGTEDTGTEDTGSEDTEADMPADTLADVAGGEAEDSPSYEAADMAAAPEVEPVRDIKETATVPHPDPDSVAAKLRRIRSVVAQSEQSYGDTDYSEDEHAQDFLDDTAAELDAALAADDAAELSATQAEDDAREADHAEETSALLANIATHTDAAEDVAEQEVDASAEDTAETQAHAPEAATPEADEVSSVEDTLAQLLADAMPEGTAEAAAERPLDARVVKMKRSALEEAMASGELAEEGAKDDTVNLFSDEAEDDFENALSPEEEAELQRELAEVEADFAPEMEADEDDAAADAQEQPSAEFEVEADDEVEAEDEAEGAFDVAEDELQEALDDASTAEARGVDRLQAVEKTSDVSRIFDEADSQRDDADSSARRNAIQHLRAAVAATRADQNAGVDISNDKDDSAYRSDLADMVRPRRPRAGGTARSSARPGVERPAPLKLVAEQRVDTPHELVQPRRIRTSDITDDAMQATGDTSGNFADFAEEMGAGSLPELLEAAAAYMADVEGRPQFSRPMLMGKLKEVEGDSFSREDGLRSFGQLLRQGKLQKLKGGRFAVTDETEFRAEARNAG